MVDADGARNGAGPELILRAAVWLSPRKRPVSGRLLAKTTTLPALLKADMHERRDQIGLVGRPVGAKSAGQSNWLSADIRQQKRLLWTSNRRQQTEEANDAGQSFLLRIEKGNIQAFG